MTAESTNGKCELCESDNVQVWNLQGTDRSEKLQELAAIQGYPAGWTGQIERLWEMG